MFSTRRMMLISAAIAAIRLVTLPAYPLMDKSEARYAYIAELMVQTGNWVTPLIQPGVPFWAKPILSFWLTAASLATFGFNAFAARLPAFLIFIAAGSLVFLLGRERHGTPFGLAATSVFGSSALGFYLGGTVMTDPVLMLGITLVMTSYWKCIQTYDPNRKWGYLFFVGASIGLLAKGPIGVIIPGLSLGAWILHHHKWRETWHRLPWFSGTVLTLSLVLPWYVLAEYRTPGFLHYFIVGEHIERFLQAHWQGDLYGAGREFPRGTIWLFGLVATLPWSAVLAALLFRRRIRPASVSADPWLSYLVYWVLGAPVLFTFAANVLIAYVAPSLPAFALLATYVFLRLERPRDRSRFVIGAMAVPILFAMAAIAVNVEPRTNYLHSQAGVIADFRRLTAGEPAELIYVLDRPYSADFYSGGTARLISGPEQIEALAREPHRYFVMASDVYAKLTDHVRRQLEVVEKRNESVLLRGRAAE